MGVSLAMGLCFQDHVELSQGPNNSGFAASVEQEVRQADLLDGMDDRSYSYAPSLAQTDFSEFLPLQTRDDEFATVYQLQYRCYSRVGFGLVCNLNPQSYRGKWISGTNSWIRQSLHWIYLTKGTTNDRCLFTTKVVQLHQQKLK